MGGPRLGFVAPCFCRWDKKYPTAPTPSPRARARYRIQNLSAGPLSMGPKNPTAPTPSPRARARYSSAVPLSMGPKNPTAPTPSPKARARYRIGSRSRLASSRADPATKGGRYKPGSGGAARVPRGAAELRGCRRCCCCCCRMQKSSAPFFFAFRRAFVRVPRSTMSSRAPSAARGPFRTPTPARSALEAQPGHSPLASTPPTALALADGGAPTSGAGCTSTSKASNAWEP